MILLPSRGRPQKLARFIDAYVVTQSTDPGILMTEKRDRDLYAPIKLPDNWKHVEINPSLVGKKYNDGAFVYAPGESHYFLMADDCIPETIHWDRKLIEAAGATKIAYGDNIMRPNPPVGHPCIGGDFVRALGWIAHPAFGHFYWDNVLRDIANSLGDTLIYVPEVITKHLHFTVTGDKDVFERGHPSFDQLTYEDWLVNGKESDVERVRTALQGALTC